MTVSTVFSGTTQNIIATSPMTASTVFTGTSQSIITTNPTTIYPFRSPTYSVVIPNVQNSIGHPVCKFIFVVYMNSLNWFEKGIKEGICVKIEQPTLNSGEGIGHISCLLCSPFNSPKSVPHSLAF